MDWIERTDGSARQVLGAFMKSFVPADDKSRTAGMMYLALATEAAIPADQRDTGDGPRQVEAELMLATIVGQLERGPLHDHVQPEIEARILTALTTGLGQYVLLETMSPDQAYASVDHHLDRLFLSADDRTTGQT